LNKNKITQETKTAYHESGHVFISYLNGFKFEYVTIIRNEFSWGRLEFNNQPHYDFAQFGERETMVYMGGYAAEIILRGRKRWRTWLNDMMLSGDYEQIYKKSSYYSQTEKENVIEAYINYLMVFTLEVLKKNWEYVEALAKELLSKKMICYQDAINIIKIKSDELGTNFWD